MRVTLCQSGEGKCHEGIVFMVKTMKNQSRVFSSEILEQQQDKKSELWICGVHLSEEILSLEFMMFSWNVIVLSQMAPRLRLTNIKP